MTPVIVEWVDAAAGCTSWCDPDALDLETRAIRTAGWLLPDALQGHVVVAQSFDTETGAVDSTLQIPAGNVRAVTSYA